MPKPSSQPVCEVSHIRAWAKRRLLALFLISFFALLVAEARADDHGNTIATATTVNPFGTTNGVIDFAGDHDYFRFTISNVRNFTATTLGGTDTFGDLLNEVGAVLLSNDNTRPDNKNFLINGLLNAGTYYVRVRHFSSSAAIGQYQLLLSALPPADDHGNAISSATNVSEPRPIRATDGAINYMGDSDFFRFTLTAAKDVIVATTGNTDTVGSLRDSSGVLITSNDNGNGSSNFYIARTLLPGSYYVEVRHNNPSATSGKYQLVVSLRDDHGDTIVSATAVNMPSTMSGSINYAGDNDCFRFSTPRAMYVTASSGGNTDTFGELIDSVGAVLISNDGSNNNGPNFSMTRLLGAGTYYVRVRHYSPSATSGNYQLVISGSRVPPPLTDDHGDMIEMATTVNASGATNGAINFAGDYDYFRFGFTNVRNFTATTLGVTDTFGDLLNESGVVLLSNDNAKSDNKNFLINCLLGAGTYYLRVRHSSSEVASGQYQLLLSALPPFDDHGGSISSATSVGVPSATNGAINYMGDSDFFQFTLTTQKEITVVTTGNTDTVGYLRDINGGLIASNDNSNGNANFTITRNLLPGTYFVEVRHFDSNVFSGNYQLVLSGKNTGVPVMRITQGGAVIADGGLYPSEADSTDFGAVVYWGDYSECDFEIENTGTSNLYLTGAPSVSLDGTSSPSFFVITQPQATIAPGGVTSFRVRFSPNYTGNNTPQIENAFLKISSNASSFIWAISGLRSFPNDDKGNTFAVACDLGVVDKFPQGSGSLQGANIDYPQDVDMYRFTVEAPSLEVKMYTTGSTTDTFGILYHANGAVIATDNDSNGSGHFMIRKTLSAGTYYLSVMRNPSGYSPGGPYSLWLGRP